LGQPQCHLGHCVLFRTLVMIANRLSAAEAARSFHLGLKMHQNPALLLVDGMGYVHLHQPESHILFQAAFVRHDKKKPMVITTNRVFDEWSQIFANDAVAPRDPRPARRAGRGLPPVGDGLSRHAPPPRAEGTTGVTEAMLPSSEARRT